MSIIAAIIGAIAKVLFGRWFGRHEPTEADRAAEAATAETTLQQEESDNAVLTKAGAARAAADTAVLRTVTENGPAVDPAVNAKLKEQFPGEFRD